MTLRRPLTAAGAGLTTLLVVAALLTALLPVEFSALVGLPMGVLAGLGAVAAVLDGIERMDSPAGRVAGAYGTVGYVVLAFAAASYANAAGVRGALSVLQWLAVAVGASIVVYVALTLLDADR